MILVTGGAGFIGSNFVLDWLDGSDEPVLTLDKLTYAGNMENLASVMDDARHTFVHGDILDGAMVLDLLMRHRPRAILHFAAESHVDRSIRSPRDFVQANVMGTLCLLEAARACWESLAGAARDDFRFVHISTDEVYGSLEPDDAPFTESHPFAPNSPYSASKAGSDHLVRAWHHTYGLPVLTGNCSNNYGPFQFPEKLIPLCIVKALAGEPLPVYGDGQQVRDWLYVGDHCAALRAILENGQPGQTWNIGGGSERTNLKVVQKVCVLLDEMQPRQDGNSYTAQITCVADRPGHDRRYAIDARKIGKTLRWKPQESFDSGMRKTVQWYLEHPQWVQHVQSGEYRNWLRTNYAERH